MSRAPRPLKRGDVGYPAKLALCAPFQPRALRFIPARCDGGWCSFCQRPTNTGVEIRKKKGGDEYQFVCKRCIRDLATAAAKAPK